MNWQKLISEILSKGLSQVDIGKRLGRSQAWVSAVVAGKYRDVGWTDGEAIRSLHREVVVAGNSPAGQEEARRVA